jgi:hypothetical protein
MGTPTLLPVTQPGRIAGKKEVKTNTVQNPSPTLLAWERFTNMPAPGTATSASNCFSPSIFRARQLASASGENPMFLTNS